MKKLRLMILLCLALLLAGCGGSTAQTTEAAVPQSPAAPAESRQTAETEETRGINIRDYRITLITMDSIDQHWADLRAGAEKAAEELGLTVTCLAPETKNDEAQIRLVHQAVEEGCDALVIAANDPETISDALAQAVEAGVKLIYVDSPAEVPAEATFCTDNYAAGETAGETMLSELTNRGITSGKIGILNVNADTASSNAREEGFRNALKGTDFELLDTRYSDGDTIKAQYQAAVFLSQQVVGLFACNEGSTAGAGVAVRNANAHIVCVGFDRSEEILYLIDEGCLYATMTQNAQIMGYEGIRAAVAALNGEDLGGVVIDTGVSVLAG